MGSFMNKIILSLVYLLFSGISLNCGDPNTVSFMQLLLAAAAVNGQLTTTSSSSSQQPPTHQAESLAHQQRQQQNTKKPKTKCRPPIQQSRRHNH